MVRNGCAHCHSPNIQFGFDRYECLDCAGATDMEGNALPRDPKFYGGRPDQFAVRGSGRP